MRRIGLVLALSLTLAPLAAAEAQSARKTPGLCFLTFDPGGTTQTSRFDAFFQVRALGYVNGKPSPSTISSPRMEISGDRGPRP
jgi:hypothetical protein